VAREDHRNEFEEAVQADMMVNSLIRIAKDLERAIIGIFATAGLLGGILFILILRWIIEGH
jgi:hypothetical protein